MAGDTPHDPDEHAHDDDLGTFIDRDGDIFEDDLPAENRERVYTALDTTPAGEKPVTNADGSVREATYVGPYQGSPNG